MEEEILETSQIILCMMFMGFLTAFLDSWTEPDYVDKPEPRKMYRHLEDLA